VSQPSPLSRIGWLLARPGSAVIVGFVIRAGWQYSLRMHGPYPIIEPVPYGYETGRIAASLAAGHGFGSPLHVPTGPTAWMTPLYPLLLAAVFRLTGILSWAGFLIIGMLNCAFSALTAWPVSAIGRKAFGEATGVTAGWLWVFLPTAVYYPVAWVWDTCLVTLLFALVLLATLYLRGSTRATAWGGYGLLLGLTALTNAAVVSLYPFYLAWAALPLRRRGMGWLRLPALACAGFVLMMSPWWIRNYATFHRFIPLRSNFGLELWLGNNSRNPDIWSHWLHPDSDEGVMAEFKRLGEMAFMEAKQREAVEWIRAHPSDFVRDSIDRVADTWLGYDEPLWQVLRMHAGMRLLYLLSLVNVGITFCGLLLAMRRRSDYGVLFGLSLVVFPLIYYVTHSSLRYRYPIEPVMALLFSYSVVTLVTAWWPGSTAASASRGPQGAGEMTPVA